MQSSPTLTEDMAKTSLATREIIREIKEELQPLPELELQVRQMFAAEGKFLCYVTTVVLFHIVVCLSTRKSAAQRHYLGGLDMIVCSRMYCEGYGLLGFSLQHVSPKMDRSYMAKV